MYQDYKLKYEVDPESSDFVIPSSYSAKEVSTFGKKTSHVPMDKAGQVLHPNGGTIVGS